MKFHLISGTIKLQNQLGSSACASNVFPVNDILQACFVYLTAGTFGINFFFA
jgi:hypothetical protein